MAVQAKSPSALVAIVLFVLSILGLIGFFQYGAGLFLREPAMYLCCIAASLALHFAALRLSAGS